MSSKPATRWDEPKKKAKRKFTLSHKERRKFTAKSIEESLSNAFKKK